jgi:antitoxin component YwqK of YwqJK toxin-antitoxin module
MKRLFLFALLILALTSCKEQLKEEVVNAFDNGQPSLLHYVNKNNECVREVQYYESGAVKMEGGMKDDQRSGEWKSYFPDGKVQSTGFFENGLRTGEARIYHENGNLYMEGRYRNGKKVGEWITYDEQGYEVGRTNNGE